MEYQELNKLLKNLRNPSHNNSDLSFIERITEHEISNSYGEGEQGGTSIYHDIYAMESDKNVYLKITYNTDSYGSNEFPASIQFCKAKPKSVTEYEII
jgi:hypothetical protein